MAGCNKSEVVPMKKDKNPSTGVSKTNAPAVPIGDPRALAQREPRNASPPPLPNWTRYADSRLKQFCSR